MSMENDRGETKLGTKATVTRSTAGKADADQLDGQAPRRRRSPDRGRHAHAHMNRCPEGPLLALSGRADRVE